MLKASAQSQATPSVETPSPTPHTAVEDVLAIAIAATVISLGLFLMKSAGVVTGGTEGVALLLSHTIGVDLGIAIFVLAIPFYGLGLWQKGWRFTLRSAVAVTLISTMSSLTPHVIGALQIDALYGALVGNVLIGIGFLILFRHGASPAGFSIISLLAQEKLGWRAGRVQLCFDAVIVASALSYAPPSTVLVSAGGVAMVGLILSMNHRPGRYVGA
ncbi:YitT family protein [Tessaracoccus caeni]|uniref:YitT family protein n=1 Tax=Tessaracoccus caeni TaxID=3031239 RepID=UPI0023D99FD6|nr:YitT family protein [Tessaracoccus caeni]MDF1487211.1 YitT family protein [Tessaracoccus caeni]